MEFITPNISRWRVEDFIALQQGEKVTFSPCY